MMKDDEWMAAAMEDVTVVAEELFRLRQSSWMVEAKPPAILPLPAMAWGHRQPRSRSRSTVNGSRKDRELMTTRCSPTTPLSWSGGGGGGAPSPSDGGYDESCRPFDPSCASRSKGCSANEYSCTTPSKKSRKRKTFTELKEEETVLLKERVHLQRELASLRETLNEQRAKRENLTRIKTFTELKEEETVLLKERVNLQRELASLRETLNEQRAKSESLKRIKLDLNVQLANKVPATLHEPAAVFSNQFNDMQALSLHNTHSILSRYEAHDDQASSEACKEKDLEMRVKGFILPDLNMMPPEEETL